jgi:hypothetical protein
MKQTKTFTILLFAILLINACSKDNCDDSTKNLFVDKTYLPYIIPYSDTTTRLFLKNGTDTLLFKSQGLKETIEVQKGNDENDCRTYNLQKFSLTMTASDTDFFRISYYVDKDNTGFVQISISNLVEANPLYDLAYIKYYPPILKEKVINVIYDTITINKNNRGDILITKPNLGLIKVKSDKFIYELIN